MDEDKLKALLEQLIYMICYSPNYPQTAKTELLNRASEVGIKFGD